MTWLSILSAFCRLIGLAQLADRLWKQHEAKIKERKANDAATNVIRLSDAALDKQLRSEFTRES